MVNKLLDKFQFNNAVLQSVGILNPNKRLQYGDRDGKLNGLFKCYKSQIVFFFSALQLYYLVCFSPAEHRL